mgnify:FL=1
MPREGTAGADDAQQVNTEMGKETKCPLHRKVKVITTYMLQNNYFGQFLSKFITLFCNFP